jgi:hypothetical protein
MIKNFEYVYENLFCLCPPIVWLHLQVSSICDYLMYYSFLIAKLKLAIVMDARKKIRGA